MNYKTTKNRSSWVLIAEEISSKDASRLRQVWNLLPESETCHARSPQGQDAQSCCEGYIEKIFLQGTDSG